MELSFIFDYICREINLLILIPLLIMNKIPFLKLTLSNAQKVLLAFLLFAGISTVSKAQLIVGGKVGTATSAFAHDYSSNISSKKTGLVVGGFANYQVLDFLGATAEINYAQEGGKALDPSYLYHQGSITINDMRKVSSDVTLHTLEIPLMVNLTPFDFDEDIMPVIYGGISFDAILAARTKDLIYDDDYNKILANRSKENVTSSFEYWNYTAVLGAGLLFKGSSFEYMLDVRYKPGFRMINNLAQLNIDNWGTADDFSYNSLQVSLKVGFDAGGFSLGGGGGAATEPSGY